MSLEILATLGGLLFGSVGTLLTVRNHIRTINRDWAERWEKEMKTRTEVQIKEYAAQRDFEHLRRNQEQMKEAIKVLQDTDDEHSKALIQLQVITKGISHQITQIAGRLDSNTSGRERTQ
ncbi:hypothetical protein H6F67_14095 [Microcoleus sp. FACHB-1515]|uniref:hypothetical protein n=1 Tax=Cyanophyceae TaxID=3028117 RepID=UPI001682998C|nr:hypothetical protein [Microcoleus sp. FACHB-1515]MBD2090983.1 hypothetical protein [Microcoleus sp. FACHB-1515]